MWILFFEDTLGEVEWPLHSHPYGMTLAPPWGPGSERSVMTSKWSSPLPAPVPAPSSFLRRPFVACGILRASPSGTGSDSRGVGVSFLSFELKCRTPEGGLRQLQKTDSGAKQGKRAGGTASWDGGYQ